MWCVKGSFYGNTCFPAGKQRFFRLWRIKKVAKTHENYVRNGCLRNVLKIDGFLTKIELQNVAKTTQKNNIFGMDFAWEFDVFFEHVLGRKWSQNGSKKGSKFDPKMMRNRCPRQDAVLGRFWVDFGLIWGRFWVDSGTVLGWFWDDFGSIFGPISHDTIPKQHRSQSSPILLKIEGTLVKSCSLDGFWTARL